MSKNINDYVSRIKSVRIRISNCDTRAFFDDVYQFEALTRELLTGFLPLPDSPYRLFRRIGDIETLFNAEIY